MSNNLNFVLSLLINDDDLLLTDIYVGCTAPTILIGTFLSTIKLSIK